MVLRHLEPTTSAGEPHEILERDGALVVDGLADPELIDRITDEMAPHIDATPTGGDDFAGRTTKRTGALVARSPASHKPIRDPCPAMWRAPSTTTSSG